MHEVNEGKCNKDGCMHLLVLTSNEISRVLTSLKLGVSMCFFLCDRKTTLAAVSTTPVYCCSDRSLLDSQTHPPANMR